MPFVSKGFVSLNENSTPKPIRMLRSTGASQTLLLEAVLPLSENTSVGGSVSVHGFGSACFDVPSIVFI